MNPEITVTVIISITHSSLLKESIESILNQTFSKLELIILDFNSKLNQHTINQFHDPRMVYIKAAGNHILSLNNVISKAKGSYITLTDANSIMYPHKLEKQYKFLEMNPGIDCCSTGVNLKGYCNFKITADLTRNELLYLLLFKNPIIHTSVIYRKEALIEFKLFHKLYEKTCAGIEHYSLFTRLLMKGCNWATLPETLLDYHTFEELEYDDRIMKKEMRIQVRLLNYINSLIAKMDPDKINAINEKVTAYQAGEISLYELKKSSGELYKNRCATSKLNPPHTTDKMKILFCIQNLNSGGAEKQLITLLEHINYDIYDVDLLVLTKYGVYFENIPENVNWYTLGYFEEYSFKEYDVEIAFLEGLATKYIAHRKTNAKIFAWVRVDLLNCHWTNIYFESIEDEKSCYLKFDKIIFNSDETLERFNERFGDIAVSKTRIYDLIDRENIISRSKEYQVVRNPKDIVLCSIGRLDTQKRYDRLLSILKVLDEEGLSFHFWILGEGRLKQQLEEMIHQLSLGEKVTLLGFHKNPYPYIEACDVFVQASLAEGFSLVVAEALCLGKPILATNTAGPTELLNNGEYGYLVKNEYNEILNGLRDLILNKELRSHLSKKSLLRSSMFDIENSVNEVMNVLLS